MFFFSIIYRKVNVLIRAPSNTTFTGTGVMNVSSVEETAAEKLSSPTNQTETNLPLKATDVWPYTKSGHLTSGSPSSRPTISDWYHEVPWTQQINCSVPKDHVVFVKTHKTGSTSLATIFQRYGYYRDMTFALPATRHYFQPVINLFSRQNMAQIGDKYIAAFKNHAWAGYNFITNHARYNRREMDYVIHNATYVTILRSPAEQFESAFGYFELGKYIGLGNAKNPLESFMERPQFFVKRKFTAWYWARNGQLYDLGFDHVHDDDSKVIQQTIQRLDREFDLVLLTEYFDESLLLLRRLLCWEWDDILYLPKGIRSSSHRNKMSDELRDKIIKWNKADVKMYDHFNRTLWRRIREYGPTFDDDLRFFRSKIQSLRDQCIDSSKTNIKDQREVKPVLKSTASEFCHRVFRSDEANTNLIRQKMTSKGFLKVPPPKAPQGRMPHHRVKRSYATNMNSKSSRPRI